MGILSSIVAAEEDEYAAVGESQEPLEEWSGIQKRGLDTAKIVMLHCLLTGEELDLALTSYEPVYVAEETGTVVLRIAGEAVEKLASLDEEALEQVAEELAATEEFEVEQWDADDVLTLIMELADLACLAESQGQVLFVLMQPMQG
jgi:hypothetical protein